METIPEEMFRKVLWFVAHDSPKYATEEGSGIPMSQLAAVDRHWQEGVEEILFRHLDVCGSDFPDFKVTFEKTALTKLRRRKLRSLTVNLEPSDMENVIASADQRLDLNPRLTYRSWMQVLVDRYWTELRRWKGDLRVTDLKIQFGKHPELWIDSTFRVDMDLPLMRLYLPAGKISTLRRFTIEAGHSRVWPADCVRVMRYCTALEEADFTVDDEKRGDAQLERQEARVALAAALHTLPPSVKTVRLHAKYRPNLNQEWTLDRLLSVGKDIFSADIRRFSHRLTKLTLHINQISPEILWAQGSDASTLTPAEPHWPHLTHLDIRTSCELASGEYALEGFDPTVDETDSEAGSDDSDGGGSLEEGEGGEEGVADFGDLMDDEEEMEDDDEEEEEEEPEDDADFPHDIFRIRPDHDVFNSLALSAARAASCMPKLVSLTYHMKHEDADSEDYNRGHGLYFRAAGYEPDPKIASEGIGMERHRSYDKPRVEWALHCPKGQLLNWRPPLESRRLWKEKCGEHVELDLVIYKQSRENSIPVRRWIRERNGVRVGLDE